MGGLPSKITNLAHKAVSYIQRIPRRIKIYIVVTAACTIGVPLIINRVGFTPAGVRALSLAAEWHATIGNVAAGSVFAILQSLGTAPALLAVIGFLIAVAGCSLHYLFSDEDNDGESGLPEK